MKTLLYFIADYCMDLLYVHNFKFVDSIAADTRSDGQIKLSNGKINIYFCQDRGIDTLEVRRTASRNVYSLDILYEYLTSTKPKDGNLDVEAGEFIRHSISEILDMFSDDNYAEAEKKLDALVEIRMKRMWG